MNKRNKFKRATPVIGVFFIIFMTSVNIPRDASAYTLKSDDAVFASSERHKDNDQGGVKANRSFSFSNDQDSDFGNKKGNGRFFQNSDQSDSGNHFDDYPTHCGKNKNFKLIREDFCQWDINYPDWIPQFPIDRDHLGHDPTSSVPLPPAAFFFGTGLVAALVAMASRKI